MSRRRPSPEPNRPGRPVGFARDEAIAAAMNLFWKKGYLGVSVSDLAESMAIQRSSFYNTFGSRDAVFREALRHYAEISPDAALDRVQPGEPVLPVLASVFREICRVRAQDKQGRACLVCNSVAELVGVEAEVGSVVARSVERRVKRLAALLKQAVKQKELTGKIDVDGAAHALTAFLIGLNTISKVQRDEESLWAMCVSFLRGIGVPEAILDRTAKTFA